MPATSEIHFKEVPQQHGNDQDTMINQSLLRGQYAECDMNSTQATSSTTILEVDFPIMSNDMIHSQSRLTTTSASVSLFDNDGIHPNQSQFDVLTTGELSQPCSYSSGISTPKSTRPPTNRHSHSDPTYDDQVSTNPSYINQSSMHVASWSTHHLRAGRVHDNSHITELAERAAMNPQKSIPASTKTHLLLGMASPVVHSNTNGHSYTSVHEQFWDGYQHDFEMRALGTNMTSVASELEFQEDPHARDTAGFAVHDVYFVTLVGAQFEDEDT